MKTRETAIKLILDEAGKDTPLCFKQNGTLKLYKLVEIGYGDLNDVPDVQIPEKKV